MVYAHVVNRITLSGTMFGSEIWTTGFFLGQEGANASPLSQAGLDQIKDAWAVYHASAGSQINSNWKFTQAKSALIDESGHTIDDSVKYSYPAATVSGGTAVNTHPAQCSLVVTLMSDRPRGLASKGRMYLPGYSGGISATGKASSADILAAANGLKTFFDSFAADPDVPDQLILAAKGVGPLPALTAQNDYVESFRIGDVIDTQRRRRNKLVETYTSKVLL